MHKQNSTAINRLLLLIAPRTNKMDFDHLKDRTANGTNKFPLCHMKITS